MVNKVETSPGSQSEDHKLSQEELRPQVKDLFNGFKLTFQETPEFMKNLGEVYFSTMRGMGEIRSRKTPLGISFIRGLDRWTVRYSVEEKDRVLSECLKIEVHGDYIASETALRFKIVTLRIPYLADKDGKNKEDVDISYDQRNLLVSSSPTDIHQDKTASAIKGAEQMLVNLKAPPAS